MFLSKTTETSTPFVDRASQAVDQATKSTRNVAPLCQTSCRL